MSPMTELVAIQRKRNTNLDDRKTNPALLMHPAHRGGWASIPGSKLLSL